MSAKGFIIYLAACLFTNPGIAQFNPLTNPLVYHSPEMDKVTVQKGVVYSTVNADTVLNCNVYYPPSFDRASRLPVVIFNNGVGGNQVPEWKIYDDWARLAASHGFIAVTHQSRQGNTARDLSDLLQYLRKESEKLRIDKENMGIWVCSANTRTGWPAANDPQNSFIKAVAIYYGVTRPQDRMVKRKDLGILLVRAGLDGHNINAGMEELMADALAKDAHVGFINYPEGQHAFDGVDNTSRSKEIILQTIAFFKQHLTGDNEELGSTLITNRQLWQLVLNGRKTDEALAAFKTAYDVYSKKPGQYRIFNQLLNENNLNGLGYELLRTGNTDDAIKVFELNTVYFPGSANGFDALSDAYERKGDKANTLKYAELALEKLAKDSNITPQFAQAIRAGAMGKINNFRDIPHRRAHHELVYHEGEKAVLLVSGSTPLNGGQSFKFFNDVWEYKGNGWQKRKPAGDERSGIRLAYDSKRNQLVSYGGFTINASNAELRVLEGNGWKVLSNLPAMAATEAGLVYDAGRDRLVAFGGSKNRGESNEATWVWDGYAWKDLYIPGPGKRQAFAMVYDSKRNKTILFGGMNGDNKRMKDTWELDGNTWKLVDTSGPAATGRLSPGYAYDSKRGLLIIFGGVGDNGLLGDTWSWDGKSWRKLRDTGPSPRAMGYMAYDKHRDRVVLFGGRAGWPNDMNDTWEWDGKEWKQVLAGN